MRRLECLRLITEAIDDSVLAVTNIGGIRREFNGLRPSDANFNPQAMGSTAPVALGLALALPHRKVLALDGDGSILMSLGHLTTSAVQNPPNLIHIVFDNSRYEASGGLPTATATAADLATVAAGCGFPRAYRVTELADFADKFRQALAGHQLTFLCARVEPGTEDTRSTVPFTVDGQENKYRFLRYIERTEGITLLREADSGSFAQRNG